jgi:lipid-A-disaccharide synthase-like uncharacterized protein
MIEHLADWFAQPWKLFSVIAQLLFFMRFFVQWLHSEKKGRTVVPDAFWTFSILGGGALTIYFLHNHDWAPAVGQGSGLLIYLRNFYMIQRNRARAKSGNVTAQAQALLDQLREEIGKPSDLHDRPLLVEEKLSELEALLRPNEIGTA